jgi:hypothetical protein
MINPAIELQFAHGQIQGVLVSADFEVQLPASANIGALGELQTITLASDTRKVRLAVTSPAGSLIRLQDLGAA